MFQPKQSVLEKSENYEYSLWYDRESVNKVRRMNGLPELRPATVKCLKCSSYFDSFDKRLNRLCDTCREGA